MFWWIIILILLVLLGWWLIYRGLKHSPATSELYVIPSMTNIILSRLNEEQLNFAAKREYVGYSMAEVFDKERDNLIRDLHVEELHDHYRKDREYLKNMRNPFALDKAV